MGVVLAPAAALCYGTSDFAAGLLSRRTSSYAIAVASQSTGAVVLLATAMVVPGRPSATAMAWGALSGIGSGLGTIFLFRGLGSARMSVVAPLSAVGAAGLPVVVGLALGERPAVTAVVGIVLALPAIWLISRGGPGPADAAGSVGSAVSAGSAGSGGAALRSGVPDGLLAGASFALLFVALSRVPADAGLWPLGLGQVVAAVTIVVATVVARAPLLAPVRPALGAAASGVLSAAATLLYQLATHDQLLAVAAVLTSLYPAITVLAAVVVLRERVGLGQAIGLGAAAGAVVLVTLR